MRGGAPDEQQQQRQRNPATIAPTIDHAGTPGIAQSVERIIHRLGCDAEIRGAICDLSKTLHVLFFKNCGNSVHVGADGLLRLGALGSPQQVFQHPHAAARLMQFHFPMTLHSSFGWFRTIMPAGGVLVAHRATEHQTQMTEDGFHFIARNIELPNRHKFGAMKRTC